MGHLVTLFQNNKIIVQDGFNRADSATTLGNANTGQTWTYPTNVLGIASNAAYVPVGGLSEISRGIIETGKSDVDISCIFTVIGLLSNRLVFRYSDTSNEMFLTTSGAGTGYELYRRSAGAATVISSFALAPVNRDVMRIIASGSSVKVYINGVLRMSVTETANLTATKHGIAFFNTDTTIRTDNFRVEALQ